MKAAVIEHGQEIKMVDIEQDGSGSYLSALQSLVGGNVEAIDALYGDSPLLWANEEGILSALTPSRALYTNKRMENLGYLSRDGDHVVKDGELYAIIFRTAVA